MFHKRQKIFAEKEPDNKRFRHNVANLFLTNNVSAIRAGELYADAKAAGAGGVDDLVPAASSGKNAARDLRTKLLKRSPWFPEYFADIPCYNPKSQKEEMRKIPFLLPHEVVTVFLQRNNSSDFLDSSALCKASEQHFTKMVQQFGASDALALGLWIDGTPYNFDRSQTLECLCLNFPGLPSPNATLRVPLACIPKHWCIKGVTLSKMLGVLAWSFISLATGVWPCCRHDGAEWQLTDIKRKKKAKQPLNLQGFLVEVRGDWAMRKEVFQFPGWRDRDGCCHLCQCKPPDMRDFESCRPFQPLDHYSLMATIAQTHGGVNELFKTPGLTSKQFLLDWLHIVDLGITCDFLGNLFQYLVQSNLLDGNTYNEKVKSLFRLIQDYYRRDSVENKLPTLTLLMIRKKSTQSPKLRAKAAEARGLVTFGHEIAQALLNSDNVIEQTIQLAAKELWHCYNLLSKEMFDSNRMLQHGRKFLLLCKSLESEQLHMWKIKPKHHSFLDLLLEGNNPSDNWTYRDEDFGGFVASLAAVRGGSHNPHSIGISVLQTFRGQAIPDLKDNKS